MMEPPPLLETLFGEDGTETVKPLKAIKDKLGVGDGPLAEVKRFIPPIGQGRRHSLDRRSRSRHFHLRQGGAPHEISFCELEAGFPA